MILNDTQIGQIVDQILAKTAEGKLHWVREGDRLLAGLPNQTTVELVGNGEGSDLLLQVKGASDVLFGELKSPRSLESPVFKLYALASEKAAASLFMEIMDSLSMTDSAAVEVVRPLPRVSSEQAARVLKKMEGRWILDYSRGQQPVKITADGAVFRNDEMQPAFRLKVLAWNEATSSVEVAKDRPDGRRLQIEYLTIAPNTMRGYAKHDGHALTYLRIT